MTTSAYIIIGRDHATGKLLVSHDGKTDRYGEVNSVPDGILENHCRLDFSDGLIRLKNLDINSYTYVNGQAVETKAISRTDRIEMGEHRYLLDWQIVNAIIPPEADIRPLQEVWSEFDRQSIKLQIDERRFNTLRSATGLITMIAIALSIISGRQNMWYIAIYAFAIIASLAFTVKAYRDASKVPQLRSELNRKFQHDYVCPKCGHFLGNQPYDILQQNHQCPYCHAKFIH